MSNDIIINKAVACFLESQTIGNKREVGGAVSKSNLRFEDIYANPGIYSNQSFMLKRVWCWTDSWVQLGAEGWSFNMCNGLFYNAIFMDLNLL